MHGPIYISQRRFAGTFPDVLVATCFSRNQELIAVLQGIISQNNLNF